jgi:hypothetical protein
LGRFWAILWVKFFSVLFCFKQTWGRFLAFYTLVFQAYIEAFLEAWFSHYFGCGSDNLGGHLWRPSLKGFRGILEGSMWIFFKRT